MNLEKMYYKARKYESTIYKLFATHRSSSASEKNSFVLVSCVREKGEGLQIRKVLRPFGIGFKESNERQECPFLQFMVVTCLVDMENATTGCVCPQCSTDDEVEHNLRQDTSSLKLESHSVGK